MKKKKRKDTSVPYIQRKAQQDSDAFYEGCLAGMRTMKVLHITALWNVYDSITRKLSTPQAAELAQALYPELFRLQHEMEINTDFAEQLMYHAETIAAKFGVKLWEEAP